MHAALPYKDVVEFEDLHSEVGLADLGLWSMVRPPADVIVEQVKIFVLHVKVRRRLAGGSS